MSAIFKLGLSASRAPQFYMILKLQQGVWPELPHVHIWDYAR